MSTDRRNYVPPRSASDLLQRFRAGERLFQETEIDGSWHEIRERPDRFDLSRADLRGIDLSRSLLTVDFRGANLEGANFTDANVKTCDFRNANLEGARFDRAALDATQFGGANVEGATFEGAHIQGRTLAQGERPDWA